MRHLQQIIIRSRYKLYVSGRCNLDCPRTLVRQPNCFQISKINIKRMEVISVKIKKTIFNSTSTKGLKK